MGIAAVGGRSVVGDRARNNGARGERGQREPQVAMAAVARTVVVIAAMAAPVPRPLPAVPSGVAVACGPIGGCGDPIGDPDDPSVRPGGCAVCRCRRNCCLCPRPGPGPQGPSLLAARRWTPRSRAASPFRQRIPTTRSLKCLTLSFAWYSPRKSFLSLWCRNGRARILFRAFRYVTRM